jgi:hypothetical protein
MARKTRTTRGNTTKMRKLTRDVKKLNARIHSSNGTTVSKSAKKK